MFIYLAQNSKEIAVQLEKKYRYGIAGNQQDATNMRFFIEKMYNDTKTLSGSVKSSFNRPYSSSKSMSLSDLNTFRQQLQIVHNLIITKYRQIDNPTVNALIKRIFETVQTLRRFIPTSEQFTAFNNTYSHQSSLADENMAQQEDLDFRNVVDVRNQMADEANIPRDRRPRRGRPILNPDLHFDLEHPNINYQRQSGIDLYQELHDFIKELPSLPSLFTLIEQLEVSIKNTNDELTIKILTNILSLFPAVRRIRALTEKLEQYMDNRWTAPPAAGANAYGPEGIIPIHREDAEDEIPEEKGEDGLTNSEREIARNYAGLHSALNSIEERGQDLVDELRQANPNMAARLFAALGVLKRQFERNMRELQQQFNRSHPADMNIDDLMETFGDGEKNHIYDLTVNETIQQIVPVGPQAAQAGGGPAPVQAGGEGLRRGRGRPRGRGISIPIKDNIDYERGVEPERRFVKLGKFLINTNKLKDNVVAIKRPSGTNIIEFPSQRVSNHLSGVFRKIIGGGIPDYNDLSKLNEDERRYLYNVSKKANVSDKLNIPVPSKDQRDQDIHEYEVMKGEILSGNDNKEFIKKFKLHMSKLSRQGVLPKKEVNEILTDLLELGH